MIVTFCGHSELPHNEAVRIWLEDVVASLISEGAREIYLGGYGAFDRLAASVLREKKKTREDLKLVMVLPYLNDRVDTFGYDYIVYPPLEAVPSRFAISKRNEWMVQKAAVVVAYVTRGWGSAAKALDYARRIRKRVILFPDSAD